MFNFDYIKKEYMKEHNPNWPEKLDYPYTKLIAGGSGSGNTNTLLNLINQPDIGIIFCYARDPFEAKYQLPINKRESIVLKYLNDSKAFTEYSNHIDDIYKDIEEYNLNKQRKELIVFDDLIACMLSNKKLNPIVTELFITGRKLNMSLLIITQSCFAVPKNVRLNSAHYFIMKIPNKRECQHIAFHHSSDIDFQDFMNLYKRCAAKPYSFLVIDTTLASDNLILHISERIYGRNVKIDHDS